jgi:hypothetical protein
MPAAGADIEGRARRRAMEPAIVGEGPLRLGRDDLREPDLEPGAVDIGRGMLVRELKTASSEAAVGCWRMKPCPQAPQRA